RGDRHEHAPFLIHPVRRARLGADEARDLADHEAQRFGQIGLGRDDAGDGDEELGGTHSVLTIRQPHRRTTQIPQRNLATSLTRIGALGAAGAAGKPAQVLVLPRGRTLAHRVLSICSRKIPEMGTRRVHRAHMRKRFAQVALEAALLATLLLPWAAILTWLFWRNALR